MANEKRLIPLQKRIVYAGDVFNSLMSEKRWSATEAADFLQGFRTVDAVEVVHGRWIVKEHSAPYGGYHLFHCSKCDEPNAREKNYCANCGAKMDGGVENA